MVGRRELRVFSSVIALVSVVVASSAFSQTSPSTAKLGLYDKAGYPYYPIETQVYGVTRGQPRLLTVRATSAESPSDRVATRSLPLSSPTLVSRRSVANTLVQYPQDVRLRPMPVPDSMIMDPWAVGVFR